MLKVHMFGMPTVFSKRGSLWPLKFWDGELVDKSEAHAWSWRLISLGAALEMNRVWNGVEELGLGGSGKWRTLDSGNMSLQVHLKNGGCSETVMCSDLNDYFVKVVNCIFLHYIMC